MDVQCIIFVSLHWSKWFESWSRHHFSAMLYSEDISGKPVNLYLRLKFASRLYKYVRKVYKTIIHSKRKLSILSDCAKYIQFKDKYLKHTP